MKVKNVRVALARDIQSCEIANLKNERAGFSAFFRQVSMRAGALLALIAILTGLYLKVIRPVELHWGATPEEIARSLPEDNSVLNPAFDATRAITIRGRPEDIWPWLAQMGYNRAGFYGYDLIENLGSRSGLRSATALQPAWQHPQVGEPLPLSVAATLQFGTIDPPHTLVWRGGDVPPSGVFIWALVPVDGAHTRLISRIRWRYLPDAPRRALGLFTEFADHVAVRAILRGVRDRVEGRTPPSLLLQGFEIAGWFLACVEFAVSALFVVLRRRWGAAWLDAFGSGLLLLFVLYAGAPVWVNAILPWVWLAWLVARRRMPHASSHPEPQTVRVP